MPVLSVMSMPTPLLKSQPLPTPTLQTPPSKQQALREMPSTTSTGLQKKTQKTKHKPIIIPMQQIFMMKGGTANMIHASPEPICFYI
jgi:hypothetical protein